MSESRAIQPYGQPRLPAQPGQAPAGAIMTPQGPAIIQVIDMPTGLGPPGAAARPAPGFNILSAILRRWWLVLLVTLLVGGAGFVAANKFMQPVYPAYAVVRYVTVLASNPQQANLVNDPATVIRANIDLLTRKEIVLEAAKDPELQQAYPWLKNANLSDPARQKEIISRFRDICVASEDPRTGLIHIEAEMPDGMVAAATVNSFARAFVAYCMKTISTQETGRRAELRKEIDDILTKRNEYQKQYTALRVESDPETKSATRVALLNQLQAIEAKRGDVLYKRLASQAVLDRFNKTQANPGQMDAAHRLKYNELLENERNRDALYQSAMNEWVQADAKISGLLAGRMKEDHPEVQAARKALATAATKVEKRDGQIHEVIRAKILERMNLEQQSTVDKAEADVKEADHQLALFTEQYNKLKADLKALVPIETQMQALQQQIDLLTEQHREAWRTLQEVIKNEPHLRNLVEVADLSDVPTTPSQDKRVKVQAAGAAGGLFLGILLALLVDRFDKRLRDPRDIEPLLGAPVLGMIPKIQELKRIKGEQARNLIAEEFRIIRTQILFGNPNLQYKLMCVTSPAPGDGKTSLAVNLAISIAKAGRRVLLVDGDLRKPDIHRIFQVPDSPGLAELIHGTIDPGAAIRKTDIENLDVLPAGMPMIRPSELLSRPEMGRLLGALGELYDHVVFDSAPLLPVSDTHVLAGMMDGVICSFNADVTRDVVKLVEDILRRSNARLIGSVMNQVKYKQTNTYYRGKSAYDSYYNSPRGAGGSALAKPPDPPV